MEVGCKAVCRDNSNCRDAGEAKTFIANFIVVWYLYSYFLVYLST